VAVRHPAAPRHARTAHHWQDGEIVEQGRHTGLRGRFDGATDLLDIPIPLGRPEHDVRPDLFLDPRRGQRQVHRRQFQAMGFDLLAEAAERIRSPVPALLEAKAGAGRGVDVRDAHLPGKAQIRWGIENLTAHEHEKILSAVRRQGRSRYRASSATAP